MKAWIISLVCGVAAGVLYALLDVHSPAPPVVALLGLFGMLVGEQLIPIGRRLVSREPLTLAWFRQNAYRRSAVPRPQRPRRKAATRNDLFEERQHDAAVAHCHH